jgi:hypothetical protein
MDNFHVWSKRSRIERYSDYAAIALLRAIQVALLLPLAIGLLASLANMRYGISLAMGAVGLAVGPVVILFGIHKINDPRRQKTPPEPP